MPHLFTLRVQFPSYGHFAISGQIYLHICKLKSDWSQWKFPCYCILILGLINNNLWSLEMILWNACLGFKLQLSITSLIWYQFNVILQQFLQLFFNQKCYHFMLHICRSALMPVSLLKTTMWFAFQIILINPSLD